MLKILDLCIKTQNMSNQFTKMKGFAILGNLLQNFEVSEELFGVLVCMMLGKAAYRFQSQECAGASYIQAFFLGQLNHDLTLQHPAAVTTILTLLGSTRDISISLQHSIIKIIHGILFLKQSNETSFI